MKSNRKQESYWNKILQKENDAVKQPLDETFYPTFSSS